MRSTTLTVGRKSYELRATWGAGVAIHNAVGMDPMSISQESQAEIAFQERGIRYPSKFNWTMDTIFAVLRAGLDAGKDDLDDEGLQEAIMELGFEPAGIVAVNYLGLFITSRPAKIPTEGAGEPAPGG